MFAAISSIAGLMQATEIQLQRENQERPYIHHILKVQIEFALLENSNVGKNS
jgi:hypothetical protein